MDFDPSSFLLKIYLPEGKKPQDNQDNHYETEQPASNETSDCHNCKCAEQVNETAPGSVKPFEKRIFLDKENCQDRCDQDEQCKNPITNCVAGKTEKI